MKREEKGTRFATGLYLPFFAPWFTCALSMISLSKYAAERPGAYLFNHPTNMDPTTCLQSRSDLFYRDRRHLSIRFGAHSVI